jgi:hypothetical protein
VSIALYAAVLCWALVSFASAPTPFDAPAASDPIDVELLPPSDVTQQKLGNEKGKPSDQITKDTKASAKESDGKRAGDSKSEEPPPPPPEQKPTPPDQKPQEQAATPPPPQAKPEPPKPDLSKLAKVDPVPVPPAKPDLPIEGDKAKEVGVGKPPEAKPEPSKDQKPVEKPIEKPTEAKETPKDQQAIDKLINEASKAEKAPDKKPDVKPPQKPVSKTQPTKVADLPPSQTKPSTTPSPLRGETTDIKNRVETGTSASKTQMQASLGNRDGPNTPNVKLSQSQLEALNGMLRSQISECWNVQAGWSESGVKVVIHVTLNQDGTLSGDPEFGTYVGATSPLLRPIMASAVRAVKMCAARHPFKLPIDKYAAWASNDITFDPSRP